MGVKISYYNYELIEKWPVIRQTFFDVICQIDSTNYYSLRKEQTIDIRKSRINILCIQESVKNVMCSEISDGNFKCLSRP